MNPWWQWLPDLLFVVGWCMTTIGLWMWCPWIALVVSGGVLMMLGLIPYLAMMRAYGRSEES